jgi:uncharacterized Zn ribbon protein
MKAKDLTTRISRLLESDQSICKHCGSDDIYENKIGSKMCNDCGLEWLPKIVAYESN